MKLNAQPEWTLLGGLMKSSVNKKTEIEEHERNDPN
jgi:hypothetical protein